MKKIKKIKLKKPKVKKIKLKKKRGRAFRLLKKLGIAVVLVAVVFAGAFLFNDISNRNVKVTRYSYASKKLPRDFSGYSIMVISDYHNAVFWSEISEKINETHPDIVIFTGDLTQLHANSTSNLSRLVKGINYSVPKYFISGNHESMSADYGELMAEIEGLGLINIDDEAVKIYSGDGRDYIKLIGVKDPVIEDTVVKFNEDKIKNMVDLVEYKSEDDEFTILALHRANLFPYFTKTGSELVLSGHLHGGLIRIPGVGGLVSDDGFFPEYDAGVFLENETTMIVSRGCDYNPEKVRVFNSPEVLLVTLFKK